MHRHRLCGFVPLLVGVATGRATDVYDLEDRIYELRTAGRYQEALETARQVLALLQSDEHIKPHELVNAECEIVTLAFIGGLSDGQRREIAMADSMDAVVDG